MRGTVPCAVCGFFSEVGENNSSDSGDDTVDSHSDVSEVRFIPADSQICKSGFLI